MLLVLVNFSQVFFFFASLWIPPQGVCSFIEWKWRWREALNTSLLNSQEQGQSLCEDLSHFFYKGPNGEYFQVVAYGVPASTI